MAEQEVTAEEERYPRYRWLILIMGWAILCLTTFNNTLQNVRYDLRDAPPTGLGLSTGQFYLCITATSIAPIAIALISGLLTDRIGVKRVILYGAMIATAGALLRLAASGFVDLFIYCIIMGVGLGTVGGNVPKLVGQWFPVRQIYVGIALFTTALGIGPFLALATGAMFPTYFMAFLVMGILTVVMVVVWAIWAKDRPREYLEGGMTIVNVPFREALLKAVKSRNIWLIGIAYALVMGVIAGWLGGMPLLLVLVKQVPLSQAGVVISLSVAGHIVGIVFFTWLAEKVGRLKPVFAGCMALSGTTGLLTYLFAPGIGMWVLGALPGFFMGAGPPLVAQMPLRLREIGTRYAGTAMGMIASIGYILSFTLLPYMFNPLYANTGPFSAVLFLCLCLWLAGALFLLTPERGRKWLQKVLREAQQTGATAG